MEVTENGKFGCKNVIESEKLRVDNVKMEMSKETLNNEHFSPKDNNEVLQEGNCSPEKKEDFNREINDKITSIDSNNISEAETNGNQNPIIDQAYLKNDNATLVVPDQINCGENSSDIEILSSGNNHNVIETQADLNLDKKVQKVLPDNKEISPDLKTNVEQLAMEFSQVDKNEDKNTDAQSQLSESTKSSPKSEKLDSVEMNFMESLNEKIETLSEKNITPQNQPKKQKQRTKNLPNFQSSSTEIRSNRRKRKIENNSPITSSVSPEEKINESPLKNKRLHLDKDLYCWKCSKLDVELYCSACPRSWHRKCLVGSQTVNKEIQNWICGDCASILHAENVETRAPIMSQLTVDQLGMMLKYVVERMREQTGSEPFWKPVDLEEYSDYLDYIIYPIDISTLDEKIRKRAYGSIEAFISDCKWIQHNCYVYNTEGGIYQDGTNLTQVMKNIMKAIRFELGEMRACPDCFAWGRNIPRPLPNWFIEPCRKPHPLVWARLRGYPFWQGKALARVNCSGFVDVHFFGQHDRAYVPAKNIFLYSEYPPNVSELKELNEKAIKLKKTRVISTKVRHAGAKIKSENQKRKDLIRKEVAEHIKKLEALYGKFVFAPHRTRYDASDSEAAFKMLFPNYDPSKPYIVPPDSKEQSILPVKSNKKKELTRTAKKAIQVKSVGSTVEINHNIEKHLNQRKRKGEALSHSLSKSPSVKNTNTANKPTDNIENIEDPLVEEIISTPDVNNIKKNLNLQRNKIDSTKRLKTPAASLRSANNKTINESVKVTAMKPIQKPVKKVMRISGKKGNLIKNAISTETSNYPINKCVKKNSNLSQPMEVEVEKNIRNLKTPVVDLSNVQDIARKITSRSSTPVSSSTNNPNLLDNVKSPKTPGPVHSVNASSSSSPEVILIKQEPKDQNDMKETTQKKESKARKTLSSRPPNFFPFPPQNQTPPTSEAMVYIPPQLNDTRPLESDQSQSQLLHGSNLPPPEAGPATALIHRTSKQLADKMVQLLTETIKDTATNNADGNSTEHYKAKIKHLELQKEKLIWEHKEYIRSLKHNHGLVMKEMKDGMEAEKFRLLAKLKKEMEDDKQRCIEETKRKQWCALCGQEAIYYCCWNTAYCDVLCQKKHWSSHMKTCSRKTEAGPATSGQMRNQQKNNYFTNQKKASTTIVEKILLKPYKKVPL